MSGIELFYRRATPDGFIHEIKVQRRVLDLNTAWKAMVNLCILYEVPIPTEEDYKAGRLTKTIIQE